MHPFACQGLSGVGAAVFGTLRGQKLEFGDMVLPEGDVARTPEAESLLSKHLRLYGGTVLGLLGVERI